MQQSHILELDKEACAAAPSENDETYAHTETNRGGHGDGSGVVIEPAHSASRLPGHGMNRAINEQGRDCSPIEQFGSQIRAQLCRPWKVPMMTVGFSWMKRMGCIHKTLHIPCSGSAKPPPWTRSGALNRLSRASSESIRHT